MVVEIKKSKVMTIPATSAHLWPAGNLPDGSIHFPGRIFVGGLSSEKNPEGPIREEDLVEFFSSFGKVTDVKMIQHHEDRSFRGYAFVSFADNESADKVFEQYSDVSKRPRFVIKGLDLKIGHAVRKGSGSSPSTFMVNQATARTNIPYSPYSLQQYQQALLAAAAYSQNPYLVGSMGAVADPLTGAIMFQNPMLQFPNNASQNPTLLTPGKVATPVPGPPLNSPQTGKLIDTTNPHSSLPREFINYGSAAQQPISSATQAAINSLTGPIDTNATAQALLNPYNLRCQAPYYNNYLLPQLGVSQPPTVLPTQYCNTAGIPTTGLYDPAVYTNSYLCLPTNGYIAPNVSAVQQVNDLESTDAYGNSKVNLGIFDPPPAKTLNLATTIATTMAHVPKRDQGEIPVPITFENQLPTGLQVHFANSPHVEEINNANVARASMVSASEAKQELQSRNYKHVIESEPMYYQKGTNY